MRAIQKTILFGDSITQFWQNYDAAFFETFNLLNKGISGQTTTQMRVRFENDVLNLQPKMLIILAGINDIAENNGPILLEEIMQNIILMIKKATDNTIEVILCTVLPTNYFYWNPKILPAKNVIELNKMIRDYANSNDKKLADYYSQMVDTSNGLQKQFSTDGVHPNLIGYLKMRSILEPYLML